MNMLYRICFCCGAITVLMLAGVSLLTLVVLAGMVTEANGATAGTAWLIVACGTLIAIVTRAVDGDK